MFLNVVYHIRHVPRLSFRSMSVNSNSSLASFRACASLPSIPIPFRLQQGQNCSLLVGSQEFPVSMESYTRAFFLTCGCSQYLMIIKFFKILCSRPATSVACWRKRTVFAILCKSKSFGEDERNPDRKVLSRTCRAGTE